ncbi:Uncharacterized protein YR821_0565 [Yersinia ruckeri]|uniref:Uncharacterized protein n=1 Tax=Yersinia ruckeri TaxID=29486 RepID=A0A0A8V9I0_YERRU|nr:Uncharacterized protein YR821_0565 [Yersinia ruckeri]CEK26392.1 hypothetical protein CSF007_3065 [Yersinia ruckeri]
MSLGDILVLLARKVVYHQKFLSNGVFHQPVGRPAGFFILR